MPTIIGTKDGTRPHLELDWSIKSQDIANNRSTINLKLYLKVDYSIGYNARYTGVLQGNAFTASAGYLSSPGRYLLTERDITVGHNSDGTKTLNFSASYNISISWGGKYHGSISLSGSGTLTPIPRGSTLSAFSFGSSLQVGTKNTVNYTVARHSGNFRLQFQLRDGGVTISTWDNQSVNGSGTLELPASAVNTLLNRMSTTTSKQFTLRVATRSGINGGWIGTAVTRNATATVHDNVKPTISSTSAVPIGNSWAVGKGFYVQGQTGVQAQFSSDAKGGAGVRSRNISIGSLSSGGSVVDGVFRHSQSRVNSTGNIKITYTITDTRGRTASSERTVNFRAYTPPQITSFTTGRANPTSSTVTVKSQGSIHGMGGQNTGTMTVRQQGVTNAVRTQNLTNTTPSFNDSFNRTVATSSSTTFTITVTDLLGNSATSTSTIGTAFMEFSIRKGTGVGIGKVHERGVLDVDGRAYFKGNLFVNDVNISSSQRMSSYLSDSGLTAADTISFWQTLPQGIYFVYVNDIPNQPESYGVLYHSIGSGDFTSIWYTQPSGAVYRKSGNHNSMSDWVLIDRPEQGWNSNGDWIRYEDGTQICYNTNFNPSGQVSIANGASFRSSNVNWTFPKAFTSRVTLFGHCKQWTNWSTGNGATNTTGVFVQWAYVARPMETMHVMAIGRWK